MSIGLFYLVIYNITPVTSSFLKNSLKKGEMRHVVHSCRKRPREYALILFLVAIVIIVIMAVLGPALGNTFSSINRSLSSI